MSTTRRQKRTGPGTYRVPMAALVPANSAEAAYDVVWKLIEARNERQAGSPLTLIIGPRDGTTLETSA